MGSEITITHEVLEQSLPDIIYMVEIEFTVVVIKDLLESMFITEE